MQHHGTVTYDRQGWWKCSFCRSKKLHVHPEHKRSLPSMALRHTVHPEHKRSLPSMALRHTVHPEHKNRGSLPC